MVAVESGRVQPTVRFGRPAVLAEFDDIFSHGAPSKFSLPKITLNIPKAEQSATRRGASETALTASYLPQRPDCQPIAFMLLTIYI